MLRTLAILLPSALIHLAAAAPALAEPTLWVSDDGKRMIYHVTIDGELIEAFPSQLRAHSGIDLDPYYKTLWGVAEKGGAGFAGLVALYDDAGNVRYSFDVEPLGSIGTEGVAVGRWGFSLYLVDDPEDAGDPTVFHVSRQGSRVYSSFPTSRFDLEAVSPQAIAYDSSDGTLWIVDNQTDRIYNVSKRGYLRTSFPVSRFDEELSSPQGISVDHSNRSLWVTGRDTHKIYNINKDGILLSAFESMSYDDTAMNPVGIAVVPGRDAFVAGPSAARSNAARFPGNLDLTAPPPEG